MFTELSAHTHISAMALMLCLPELALYAHSWNCKVGRPLKQHGLGISGKREEGSLSIQMNYLKWEGNL